MKLFFSYASVDQVEYNIEEIVDFLEYLCDICGDFIFEGQEVVATYLDGVLQEIVCSCCFGEETE